MIGDGRGPNGLPPFVLFRDTNMFTETDDSSFAARVADGVSLVLFYKEQCPFCKAMKKIITKFAQRPAVAVQNIQYLQINRETSPAMAAQWEIERCPTLLVFRDGQQLFEKSGDVTYKELERLLA
jgi:thiol-disulfide isomerase/thioredoxin